MPPWSGNLGMCPHGRVGNLKLSFPVDEQRKRQITDTQSRVGYRAPKEKTGTSYFYGEPLRRHGINEQKRNGGRTINPYRYAFISSARRQGLRHGTSLKT
jgi:hypothetical protein